MALTTVLPNIKIANNTTDINVMSGGTYTYSSVMRLGGSAIVSGNVFSGCIGNGNAGTDLTTITAGSSTLTNNTFVRGVGSPISTYINVSSVNDQVITNNVFDSNTTNGSNENLVVGLTDASIYERNKNQTSYAAVSLTNDSSSLFTFSNVLNGLGNTHDFAKIYGTLMVQSGAVWEVATDNTGTLSNTTRQFTSNIDLRTSLPDNVQLIDAKVGVFLETTNIATLQASNTIDAFIQTQDIVTSSYSAGTNSILDISTIMSGGGPSPDNYVSVSYDVNTNLTALQLNTQYISIDLSSNPIYRTKNKAINFQLSTLVMIASMPTSSVFRYTFSPLVVRYRW